MVQRVKYLCASIQVEFRSLELMKRQTWWNPICNFNPPLVRREVETGESQETRGLDSSVYTTLNIKDKAEVKDSFSNKVEVKSWLLE